MSGRMLMGIGFLIIIVFAAASILCFYLGYRGMGDPEIIDIAPMVNLLKIGALFAGVSVVGFIVVIVGGIKVQIDEKNKPNVRT
jgi:hypothetical protein